MKNIKQNKTRAIQVVSILAALTFAPPVLADCVQSDPPADTILAIDANNGCSDIQGQEGCSIDSRNLDDGECTYTDTNLDDGDSSFTVTSFLNTNGSLSWELTADSAEIDTVIVGGGARGKNNCGYVYNFDADKGFGGDCKGTIDESGNCDGTFQNVTRLDVCTDGLNEQGPPETLEAEVFPHCEDPDDAGGAGGTLDNTGITCPANSDERVIVCNFQKDVADWGATDGSDLCCQCGYDPGEQEACVVTEDANPNNDCSKNPKTRSMTVDQSETVEVILFKDALDPCVWTKTRKGWKQICS